ncbi:MAG: response regulator [Chloroflexi bacterium]|nr:response regulator [Chloroflexota bacterium]
MKESIRSRSAKRRKALTTGQVAEYCQVRPATVFNWIKAGKVKAYSTPGGHYRVRLEDFRDFLNKYNIPVDEEFFAPTLGRILIVDDDSSVVGFIQDALVKENPEVRFSSAADSFEAGVKLASFQPDVIILDLAMPNLDGLQLCRKIKADSASRGARVLVMTLDADQEVVQRAKEAGADELLSKPLAANDLLEKVQALLRQPRK